MRHLFLSALLVLTGLAVAGCQTVTQRDVAAGPDPAPAQEPAERSAAEIEVPELSFRDPDTLVVHRIVGPFRFVRSTDDGIEFDGVDPDVERSVRVLLFARGEALWALTRIENRDFLARVN